MTLKEKVKEIKKAVKSGLPKRRIDVEGNGANVRKLLKGEKVSEERIEKIYANLLEYRKNPHDRKARQEKYRNSHPEVSQKEKVKAIRKAVKSGTAKDQLDPFGGGDAIRKLESAKAVGPAKINEMYANLLSLEESKSRKASQKTSKGRKKRVVTTGKGEKSPKKRQKKDKARDRNSPQANSSAGDEQLKVRVLEQDAQIATLQEKVRILEQKVSELSGAVNPRTPLKVLGLTVTQKLDKVKGKGYRRWYAIYRENGTRRLIYIGKDVDKAEEKIQSWLEKNGRQR